MNEQIITHEFRDKTFYFNNTITAQILIEEIFSDNYGVIAKDIPFKAGDIILDIGANEGMFSIMMAKLYPMVRVIALEPVPFTYYHLIKNKELNKCGNIDTYNVGVGKPGQHTISLVTNKSKESGGSTAFCTFNPEAHEMMEVGLVSLDDAFDLYGIDRCRLLKIDVEGSEYDILYPSTVLGRVDSLVIEVHGNRRLDYMARRMDGLVTWLCDRTEVIRAEFCRMAE